MLNKILNKLRRRGDHEEWLKNNPGKGGFNMQPTLESDLEDQRQTRARMEGELAGDSERLKKHNES
jgi:hypothetical protein